MDSFLAEQTRCPVVFNSGCTGLGKEMDKMCQTRDLPMGEEVELPFWLVPKLFEQNMVGPKMPDCFDERVWQVVLPRGRVPKAGRAPCEMQLAHEEQAHRQS